MKDDVNTAFYRMLPSPKWGKVKETLISSMSAGKNNNQGRIGVGFAVKLL